MTFLKKLRELSVERCERYFFPLRRWNVLEWAGAAAGEAGEMANVAKKIRRDALMVELNKRVYDADKRKKQLKQLADEAADTIIYIDLLCANEGIDLEEAIRAKFNEVSAKYGFEKVL